MAWLTSWIRRKQLYINGTTAGTQSSYQMMITVHYGIGTDIVGSIYCGNNAKSDFSDLRFTDYTGSTLLNYWIDSSTLITGVSCNIWVQIPSILTGTNSTYIYIYYNNPSATTSSNGINTFPSLFDDFLGTSLDTTKWSFRGLGNIYGTATLSIAGSILTLTGGLNTNWELIADKIPYVNVPFAIEFYAKFSESTINHNAIIGGGGVASGFFIGNLGPSPSGKCYVSSYSSGTSQDLRTTSLTSYTHIKEVIRSGAIDYYENGLLTYTKTTYVPTVAMTGYLSVAQLQGVINADWVFIHKYANPEPTWSSTISTEQSVTLIISSTPTGAEIYIAPHGGTYVDQGVLTTSTLYVAPGNYDIKLTLGGYLDYILSNQILSTGIPYNIQATLSLIPGSLSIYSIPSGAEIYINDTDKSTTTSSSGTTISSLTPGTYNIRLTLTGYQDWTGSATVVTNAMTTVSAAFAGSTNITSTPTNAAVYLDGSQTPIGNTSLIITNLTPSTSDGTQPTQSHNYILKLSGYTDTPGSFTATAGQTITVPVTFPGSLYITSIPVGASIYIDNVLQQ